MHDEDARFDDDGQESPFWWRLLLRAMLSGLLLLTLLAAAYPFVSATVPAGSVGVRQILIPPFKGYSQPLPPGRHWQLPWISTLHIIAATGQMQPPPSEAAEEAVAMTADGRQVVLAVRSLYSLAAAAETTDVLLALLGDQGRQWGPAVAERVRGELLRRVRLVNHSDLFAPGLLDGLLNEAGAAVESSIHGGGLTLQAVLLADLRVDRRTQAELEETAASRQRLALGELDSRVEAERAKTQGEQELHRQALKTAAAQAEEDARLILSEARAYKLRRKAEADLLLAKAQADIDRRRGELLAAIPDADVYFATRMAPLLKAVKGGVMKGRNALDIQEWMDRLGVRSTAKEVRP